VLIDTDTATARAAGRYRLVRTRRARAATVPTAEQRAVIEHSSGRLAVLAGPGTGKTTTLVEAIADRIERRGVHPSALLVLTFSRRAAAELATRVAARLETTTSEPIVRTVHSFAYAIARRAAADSGQPAPRLLEAGQADLMVREILAGHADDGGRYWPTGLHAALRVPAFAAELRELMLRAAERGIPPQRIAALGRRFGRPEWIAAAKFIEEYRQIGNLRQGTAGLGVKLDQAELTTAALECLADPSVLAPIRSTARHVFVDEYQDVDPAQAALIETVAAGADELIVVGDPDQSIYAFRGAAAGAMTRVHTDQVVNLTLSRRMPPTLIRATRAVAARLPGPSSHRDLRAPQPGDDGIVEIRTLATPAQEAALVADRLRRLHVESGVAYSSMAVLMRSPSVNGDGFRRALVSAGVPVAFGGTAPMAGDPLVNAFITVMGAGVEPARLDGPAAMSLLASPIGRIDVLETRQLRRAARSAAAADDGDAHRPSTELVAGILRGERAVPSGLPADLARRVQHVAALLRLAAEARDEAAAESVLWTLWQASGMAHRLADACERGGDDARRAEDHLDAMIALFDKAADLAAQLPSAGVRGLLDLVFGEQLAAAPASSGAEDAVAILSAHAAKGLEWDVVAVVGVQDDVWPDLRPRTSLLRFTELLDAADGIEPGLPTPSALADERRLFYVAVTRARRRLIVTAVDSAETAPSRFLRELADDSPIATGWPRNGAGRPQRSLTLPSLVAELREAVCTPRGGSGVAHADGADRPGAGAQRARHAARVLALLARAGVRGAHPDSWYGIREISTEQPLAAPGDTVTLSPSQIESMIECPLRTVLDRHGGHPPAGQAQLVGMAVHALAEGMAVGASPSDMDAAIDDFLAAQDGLPPWEIGRLRRRMNAMREALRTWLAAHADQRAFLGSELLIDVTVPGEDVRPIRLRGRIDWLSRGADGRVIVTDFKTGASLPSLEQGEHHPQLAVYQLAVALGALAGQVDGPPAEAGGAELVYLATGSPRTREQSAQSAETRSEWIQRLRGVAEEAAGPRYVARTGEYCSRCPVRGSCPAQPEGRPVTR
jgi:superfamily I DNA/RNA helicase/RecB family exonuclease